MKRFYGKLTQGNQDNALAWLAGTRKHSRELVSIRNQSAALQRCSLSCHFRYATGDNENAVQAELD